MNSLSRIPPSLAESSPRRKPALLLWLYEFLLRAEKTGQFRSSVSYPINRLRGMRIWPRKRDHPPDAILFVVLTLGYRDPLAWNL